MTTTRLETGVTRLLGQLTDRAHHATPDQAALLTSVLAQLVTALDALDADL